MRSLIQPSELLNRRRTDIEEAVEAPPETLSDAELGEMHASSGRFQDALQCYQRALQKAPRNELLRERFEELRKLSPPSSLARYDGLERAEVLEPATPPPAPTPPKSGPPPSRGQPLPTDKVALLTALLARVRGSRRRSVAGA